MKIVSDNTYLNTMEVDLVPKFRSERLGELTEYAFACGYVIECRTDCRDNSISMGMSHGSYDVKGFVAGEHYYEVFHSLKLARRFYKTLRTRIYSAIRRAEKREQKDAGNEQRSSET